ncbi:MAG: glycosyltransferase family 4 protein [Candidatus Thorarchaeota archaeon]
MKILHVNPYPPEHLGGSEVFCKNLALNLKKEKNIDSVILTSDIFNKKIQKGILDNSIEIIYRNYYYNLWGINPIVNIYSFLKKELQNFDIIHAHSYIFFTSLQCALLRKLRKFPFILHIHGGVQTPKNLSPSIIENFRLRFKNLFFDKFIGKFTINSADAIISVSKQDLNIIKKRYGISHDYTYSIPNAVNTDIYKKFDQSERKYITFIGRLSYIKGFDRFIKIIKELSKNDKNLEFLIIGKGPLINLLKSVEEILPITYFESYPYEKMVEIYNLSKLVLITSRFEGMPTILLESLACETPVISLDVGGISEVLLDKKNGRLISNYSTEIVVKSILEIIYDEQKLKIFGKSGRNIILENFSWKIIVDKIEEIYSKIINI